MKTIISLLIAEEGTTAIEYGLIASLISIAAIAAMQALGTSLFTTFNTLATTLGDSLR